MKKNVVFVMMLSVCLAMSAAQAAIEYKIPQFPTELTSNPMGPWTAGYAANVWSTRSDWGAMVLSGGSWNNGTTRFPEFGTWGSNLWWTYAQTGGWGDGAGGWIFQCPATGNYSIKTNWTMYGDGGDPVTSHIRVHTAANATTATTVVWQYAYTFPAGSQWITGDDLSQVAAVQNIFLTAGSYIILEMNSDPIAGYPGTLYRFNAPSSGGDAAISYVPEPCLLTLLGLGVFGIRRHCR